MGDGQGYQDDDEKRAQLLNGVINPLASRGEDPDAPRMDGRPYNPNDPSMNAGLDTRNADPRQPPRLTPAGGYTGYQMPGTWQMPGTDSDTGSPPANAAEQPRPPSSPQTAPATGPKSFKDYVRAGVVGQDRDAAASEATTAQLAAQPDEATTLAPQLKQMASDSAYIDPKDKNHPEYQPSIGQRIFRGIKGVSAGIERGGVFGGLAEGLNTDYSAPTKAYDRATAKQSRTVASDQAQISAAQKAYQDATARAKGLSVEERANATSRHDEASDATKEETEENNAGRDAETVRHNQADEGLRGQQQTNTAANEAGNLKQRTREVNIQGGRLALEKHKQDFEEAKQNAPGGDDNIRQPLIDDAAAKLTRFKSAVSYKPEFGNYLTESGKPMSQDEYIAQINQIGADLDENLAKKKQPPLGLRYKGGPNGQEIPFQTPQTTPKPGASPSAQTPQQAPAAAQPEAKKQTIKTAKSGQQIGVGDTVMYQGQQRKVSSVDEKTGKVTGFEK